MTAVNPTATVKMTDESNMIEDTLLRSRTWIAQTPQGFKRDLIKTALENAIEQKYFVPTDDSEIVAKMTNHKVKVVKGHEVNIKVTFPSDIPIVNKLFSGMKDE